MVMNDFPKNAEYWRSIDGFPSYEVSTDGRVRIALSGKIMKIRFKKTGYIEIGLTKDKKQSFHTLHKLVATAFCVKEEGDIEVDHIDHNRTNNNYQNLRWTTRSGNMRNRPINNTNTSGYQGVGYEKSGYWRAQWYGDDGIQQSKRFSIDKYGEEQAKQMAIDYRKQMAEANGYLNV